LQTFALTASDGVRDQLSLIWGVKPFCHNDLHSAVEAEEVGDTTLHDLMNTGSSIGSTEQMLRTGEKMLLDAEVVNAGETMIMMAGRLSGHGLSSSVIVWTIGEKVPKR
jgi:pyruvate kinase